MATNNNYGETEEESLKNAKEYGIKENGYTEETWKDGNVSQYRTF